MSDITFKNIAKIYRKCTTFVFDSLNPINHHKSAKATFILDWIRADTLQNYRRVYITDSGNILASGNIFKKLLLAP